MNQFDRESIIILLDTYGFDLDRARVETVVVTWLEKYEIDDIIKAIVEAVYQHRYKAVSVSNMLAMWQRNGRARILHTPEYGRSILDKLPSTSSLPIPDLTIGLEPSPPPVTRKPLPKPRTSSETQPSFQPAAPEIAEEEPGKIDLRQSPSSDSDRAARGQIVATEHPSKLPPLPDRSSHLTTNNSDGLSDFYYKLKAIVEGSHSA